MVVVAIIALLIGLLLPVLGSAREAARVVRCAAQHRQVNTASFAYLGDHDGVFYWRAQPIADVATRGMDYYGYGGRRNGNLSTDPFADGGLYFNQISRPLNPYVDETAEVFRCPGDTSPKVWAGGATHFDYVGNSYAFNCIGHPDTPLQRFDRATATATPDVDAGLAGQRISGVVSTVETTVYFEAAAYKAAGPDDGWHRKQHNISFADGHTSAEDLGNGVADSEWTWTLR
ncbi:MAG: hypothetical protein AAF800_07655 [Planctomycetota bacterium]